MLKILKPTDCCVLKVHGCKSQVFIGQLGPDQNVLTRPDQKRSLKVVIQIEEWFLVFFDKKL